MNEEMEKLKAERDALDEELRALHAVNNQLSLDHLAVLQERDRLQAQVAQMREALRSLDDEAAVTLERDDCEMNCSTVRDVCHKALSTPAPAMVPADEYDRTIQAKAQCEQALDKVLQELKAFVPADKARVLAEALAYIDAREEIGYVSYCGMTNNRIRVEEALAIARELGLPEESDERRRD